jgi:hypothetical protein
MEQCKVMTEKKITPGNDQDKSVYLDQLSKLDIETLKLLAELSKKPGIEAKLKKNIFLIKTFL